MWARQSPGPGICRPRSERIGIVLFILGLISAVCSDAAGAASVVLTLRQNVEVTGPNVMVEEIAAVAGANDRTVERVRHIEVCAAPIPGRSRTVSREYLQRSLRKNGMDTQDVHLEGALEVNIATASTVLTAEEIRTLVQEHLLEGWTGAPEDLEIEFRSVPASIVLARRQGDLRVVLPERGSLKGNVVFHLEADGGDRAGRRFPISARIRTFEEVVVAQHRIDRHHVVVEEDLCLERWETSDLDEVFLDIPSVLGLRASRLIESGRVLREDMVERPPLIRRGDIVTVTVSMGCVSATIYGEARQDGRKGDRIRVRNLRSGKRMIARVLDAKTVEVGE